MSSQNELNVVFSPKYESDNQIQAYGSTSIIYTNIKITVKGDRYFIKGDGYEETFQKVGDNIIKDADGAEYGMQEQPKS